jgi:hypothetical protein
MFLQSFDEPFGTFINTFYRKKPYFLDVNYTSKIKKGEGNDSQISHTSLIDSSNLNYEKETIDVISENGYTIRKPLKDYVPKEIYEICQNLSKTQHQTKGERVNNTIQIERYSLNIRGLILYILAKITTIQNENENHNTSNKKNFQKIERNIEKIFRMFCQIYQKIILRIFHSCYTITNLKKSSKI